MRSLSNSEYVDSENQVWKKKRSNNGFVYLVNEVTGKKCRIPLAGALLYTNGGVQVVSPKGISLDRMKGRIGLAFSRLQVFTHFVE